MEDHFFVNDKELLEGKKCGCPFHSLERTPCFRCSRSNGPISRIEHKNGSSIRSVLTYFVPDGRGSNQALVHFYRRNGFSN